LQTEHVDKDQRAPEVLGCYFEVQSTRFWSHRIIRLLWTARQAGLDNSTVGQTLENVFSGRLLGQSTQGQGQFYDTLDIGNLGRCPQFLSLKQ